VTTKEKAKALIDEMPEDLIPIIVKKLEEFKEKKVNPFKEIIGLIENGHLAKDIDKELYGIY